MIIVEYIELEGKPYKLTKSNDNKYIMQDQTGVLYEEAIDILDSTYTYTETDEDIPTPEEPEEHDENN